MSSAASARATTCSACGSPRSGIGIAARCIGAMQRLITETTEWAINREQGGARLIDHQGVSFPLADSAADAAAGRLWSSTWRG